MENRIFLSKIKHIDNYVELFPKIGGVNNAIQTSNDIWVSICNGNKKTDVGYFQKLKDESKYIAEKCVKHGINVISDFDDDFPALLRSISSCPKLLYYKGEMISEENSIAIVGSRQSSGYGNRIAQELSYGLVKAGITVISGAARGIDTFAHTSAIKAMGESDARTIAVIGSGINVIYPQENKYLYDIIAERGVVISEYEPDSAPKAQHFPARNRIISGMSLGTIVVEAGKQSGSLITAGMAADYGREVFAVPGDVTRNSSVGTNNLIKDGAVPVCGIGDVLEVLNLSQLRSERREENLFANTYKEKIQSMIDVCGTEEEKSIINALYDNGEMQTDQLVKCTGLSVSTINGITVILELKGFIEKDESGVYTIK